MSLVQRFDLLPSSQFAGHGLARAVTVCGAVDSLKASATDPGQAQRVDGRRDAQRAGRAQERGPNPPPRPFWPCHMRARTGGKQGAIRATHGEPGTRLSCDGPGQGYPVDDLLSSRSQVRVLPGALGVTDRTAGVVPTELCGDRVEYGFGV
jgi:hypothetical protein